ncbi:MAG: ATP-binding protein [Gelidibacter sp.]|uniref:ATP-binding protein n=1 Tax=Gelidibacter sp. TaxID=2018083 RepID=UPI003263163E
MKIKKIKIKNFRSYKDEVEIEFGDLTAFVGKNDIGKSTVLEALDIFFNDSKGVIKLDKDDINKKALALGDNEIVISVCFEELPATIVIDSTNETTLSAEYSLNSNGQLEVIKKYPNAKTTPNVFIKANHPTNDDCKDLLLKKNTDLQKIIKEKSIICSDNTKNAVMRTAIWNHYITDLRLNEIELDITKGDATKSIWEQLKNYLPLYSLFQSDRKNSDGDNEVQDPLKEAVKQILSDSGLKIKFAEIASEVEKKLKEVSDRTLEKLKEMNPEIADSLNPIIPTAESLKWADVFKNVSIAGDEDIPINKRGSGVKRLILLNFFRAEAERRKTEEKIPSIVYAIEEPETSQHTEHQRKLISAFLTLSGTVNTQVIITTHSPALVKELEFQHLRLIKSTSSGKTIEPVSPHTLPYPSLNEVNFLAFSETTEEYHNELYGFIEFEGKINDFKSGKTQIDYIRVEKDGSKKTIKIISTEKIRHQIHHPENKENIKYTDEELAESINLMRSFVGTLLTTT